MLRALLSESAGLLRKRNTQEVSKARRQSARGACSVPAHTRTPPFFIVSLVFISQLTLYAPSRFQQSCHIIDLPANNNAVLCTVSDTQTANSLIKFAAAHIGRIRLRSLIFFVPRCRWHPLILSHKHTHSSSTSHCAASAVAIVISTMNTANKDHHSDSGSHKHTHTIDINTIHHTAHPPAGVYSFIYEWGEHR